MRGFFVLLCVVTLHNCLAEQITEAEGSRKQRSPVYSPIEGLYTSSLEQEDSESRERRSPLDPKVLASLVGKRDTSAVSGSELEATEARKRRSILNPQFESLVGNLVRGKPSSGYL